MSRTPLLTTLRALLSDARAARANGLSLEQLRDIRAARAERDRARAVTRHTFLATAGAATAATMIPRWSFGAGRPTVATSAPA
jgi:hypothetical protein